MQLTPVVSTTHFPSFPVFSFSRYLLCCFLACSSAFISPPGAGSTFQSPCSGFYGVKKCSCISSYKTLPFFLLPFIPEVVWRAAPTCCLYSSSPSCLTYCDSTPFTPTYRQRRCQSPEQWRLPDCQMRFFSNIIGDYLCFSFDFYEILSVLCLKSLVFFTDLPPLLPSVIISQELIFSPILSLYFCFWGSPNSHDFTIFIS